MNNFMICSFLLLFLWFNDLVSKEEPHPTAIEFQTSLSPDLQKEFIEGLELLHHFQYSEANDIFLDLQKKAPDFTLAYWGEAMTYNHPLWNEQDQENGLRTLKKLGENLQEQLAKAKDPKDKGLLKAIEALYRRDLNKITRDWLYAQEMESLYKQFPQDDEIALFYALALLGKEEGIRNDSEYMRSASISDAVLKRKPLHPGALHYFIHAVDDPVHAPLGLNAAVTYAKVAGQSPHAIHMPSHIYFALGMWDEVVKSNKKAWEMGLHSKKPVSDLHVLQWLQYGYLELGQFDKAKEVLDLAYKIASSTPESDAKSYYFQMRGTQAEQTGDFKTLPPSLASSHVELVYIASDLYAQALAKLKNDEEIDGLIHSLTDLYQAEKETAIRTQNKIQNMESQKLIVVEIILLQMKALNARQKGLHDRAYKLIQEAVKLENNLSMNIGPPMTKKPSQELLADFYLEDKQYADACKTYQKVLQKWPNRRQTMEKKKEISSLFQCL